MRIYYNDKDFEIISNVITYEGTDLVITITTSNQIIIIPWLAIKKIEIDTE